MINSSPLKCNQWILSVILLVIKFEFAYNKICGCVMSGSVELMSAIWWRSIRICANLFCKFRELELVIKLFQNEISMRNHLDLPEENLTCFPMSKRLLKSFRLIDRRVCVFAVDQRSRWRRCSCWSCPLCIHTGHLLDHSRHWPVHVCPAVYVRRVHRSPVDWRWPAVQSVPPTTTDVTASHIALVVDVRCRCSLTKTWCVGAVQPTPSPRTNDLLSPLNSEQ